MHVRSECRGIRFLGPITSEPLWRDDADLFVFRQVSFRRGMDVQLRCCRFPGQFTQFRSQYLLFSNGQVLIPEEYNAALRNYALVSLTDPLRLPRTY